MCVCVYVCVYVCVREKSRREEKMEKGEEEMRVLLYFIAEGSGKE